MADLLNEKFKDDGIILGPISPYIAFEKNAFNRTLLIKYKDISIAEPILKEVVDKFIKKSSINIFVNIDPYNF